MFGVARLLAEAGVIVGQKCRQQFIAGGDRADPVKTQFLDQAILQGLVSALAPLHLYDELSTVQLVGAA